MGKKTISEQVQAFEAKRNANLAKMTEIMDKAGEDDSTLDEADKEEYDGLKAENDSINDHVKRLKEHEAAMAASAAQVTAPTDPAGAAQVRSGAQISVHSNLPKGTLFTRYAIALARSKGNLPQAVEYAKNWKDVPQVERVLKAQMSDESIFQKTAVAAGDTVTANWATELADYTFMASEFIDLLRPATIIGRIPGLRRAPFMIRMPATASGTSSGWVGQGAPKPVSKMDFDTVTLPQHKLASICVLTEELVRFSNPAAEAIVRQDMIDSISQYMDSQFIDPTVAVSGAVSPASITYGASHSTCAGSTVANIMSDVAVLFNYFIAAYIQPTCWVMHPRSALFLSMLRTAQDVYAFPGISMSGGTFYGLPVVTSAGVPVDTGADTTIVLLAAPEIFLADDGGVTLDVSREASLQMDSAPSAGAQAMVSLWANNLVGLRAERYVTWKRRRTAAVAYLASVLY